MKILFHQRACPVSDDDMIERHKTSLREELEQARFALEIAYSGFDNVTNPDLIDCYIYEVNSIMKRYKYLLEQAAQLDMLPEEKHNETYEALSLYS